MGRVEGKVAIVTGAGSGIMIRQSGGAAIALAHDVGEESQWNAVIAGTDKAFGRLDVLVNNAGVSGKGSLADTAPEDWRALMRVNLDGVYFGTRAAIAAIAPEGKEPN